jgi:hypothetical protein
MDHRTAAVAHRTAASAHIRAAETCAEADIRAAHEAAAHANHEDHEVRVHTGQDPIEFEDRIADDASEAAAEAETPEAEAEAHIRAAEAHIRAAEAHDRQEPDWMPDATPAAEATRTRLEGLGWECVCEEPVLLYTEGHIPGFDIQVQVDADGSAWVLCWYEGDPTSDPVRMDSIQPGTPDLTPDQLRLILT